MESNTNRTRTIIYWLVIIAAVALALYFIAHNWFPQLVSKFTALLLSLFVVITGMFLRKKRS